MDTTIRQAQRQGSSYAVKATLATEIGLALLLFTFLLSATSSMQMFWDMVTYLGAVTCTLFVLSSLLFAYFIGRKAGVKIMISHKRHAWVGIFSGLKVVLFSTLLCALTALVLQAATGALETGWFLHYIMKPFAWMSVVCLVPVAMAGLWYGYKLKSKAD